MADQAAIDAYNVTALKDIRNAMKSLRTKNGQDFGYKIHFGGVTDASSYEANVVYLNADGTEKDSQVYTWDEVQAEVTVLATAKAEADAQKATDKANAKAKLIAGEALTEAEADTIVI